MTNKPEKTQTHLIEDYFNLHPEEVVRYLEEVNPEDAYEVVKRINPEFYQLLFERLNSITAVHLMEQMDKNQGAYVFKEVEPDKLALIVSALSKEDYNRLVQLVPASRIKLIEDLMQYEPGTAGSIMDTKVLGFHEYTTTDQALEHIRAEHLYNIYRVYLIDQKGVLIGSASIQDLALAPSGTSIGTIADRRVVSIKSVELATEVVQICEEYHLSSLPVVDYEDKLIGVIRYNALVNAVHQDAMEDIQSMVGASPSERSLSPISFAVKKRLPWLQINLVTSFLAAAVVGIFESTINEITALAVLLPVVAGQSGNTGAQALAVTLRGLSLREIRLQHWWPVLRKEIGTGFLNGLAVAMIAMVGVWFWSGSWGLCGVIGLSMTISMCIAGGAGAMVPIILKGLNQDPAQSSSIIITTVTDVTGFLSFLGLASIFIQYLPT